MRGGALRWSFLCVMPKLEITDSIYVSGHRGMVGSAVYRALRSAGAERLLTAGREDLDLTCQAAVFDFFAEKRPAVQVICAAVVGGIVANDSYPADFIGQNLMIQTNLMEAARRFGCNKTVFLASGCIYPRDTAQPMREEQLLSGPLEPTNQWYAIAKIAGIKMAQAYRRQWGLDMVSVLPANLYGPGDNFDLETSHVVPGMMHRFHRAKVNRDGQVEVWGTGRALREFMHVDDLAAAIVHLMRCDNPPELLNIGGGEELSIADLSSLIRDVVGYEGGIVYDKSRPDGTPRKRFDDSRMSDLGWRPGIGLRQGLTDTYRWFVEHSGAVREKRFDS